MDATYELCFWRTLHYIGTEQECGNLGYEKTSPRLLPMVAQKFR